MIIYAHDPGKINYGFSVLRVIDDNIEVLKCGTFVGVQNAKNRAELALLYGTVVDNARVVNEYEVSVGIEDVNTFVIERYMSRNVGTSLLETVNLGTGYLLSKLPRQTEIEMNLKTNKYRGTIAKCFEELQTYFTPEQALEVLIVLLSVEWMTKTQTDEQLRCSFSWYSAPAPEAAQCTNEPVARWRMDWIWVGASAGCGHINSSRRYLTKPTL
jgi:hypothetical protein